MMGKKHTRVPLSGKGFRRKLILDVLSFFFFLVSEAMERSEPSEAPGVSWARGATVEMSGSGAAAASADDEGFERAEMRARRQPALTPRLCHVLPPLCLRNGDPRLAKASPAADEEAAARRWRKASWDPGRPALPRCCLHRTGPHAKPIRVDPSAVRRFPVCFIRPEFAAEFQASA